MNMQRKLAATLGLATLLGAAVAFAQPLAPMQNSATQNAPDTQAKPKVAKVGEKAPDFTLKASDGKEYTLSEDFKDKTVVIEWTNPDCPYVKGIYNNGNVQKALDKIEELGEDYVYIAINSNGRTGSAKDLIKTNTSFLKNYKMDFPVLIDVDGAVGKAYGARHTPDVYIIDNKGVLRYLGGYTDDRRGKKGDDAVNYVVNALDQMAQGETVAPDQTERWGCSVKYAKGNKKSN